MSDRPNQPEPLADFDLDVVSAGRTNELERDVARSGAASHQTAQPGARPVIWIGDFNN